MNPSNSVSRFEGSNHPSSHPYQHGFYAKNMNAAQSNKSSFLIDTSNLGYEQNTFSLSTRNSSQNSICYEDSQNRRDMSNALEKIVKTQRTTTSKTTTGSSANKLKGNMIPPFIQYNTKSPEENKKEDTLSNTALKLKQDHHKNEEKDHKVHKIEPTKKVILPSADKLYKIATEQLDFKVASGTEEFTNYLISSIADGMDSAAQNMKFNIHLGLVKVEPAGGSKPKPKLCFNILSKMDECNIIKNKNIRERIESIYHKKLFDAIKTNGFTLIKCEKHSCNCTIISWAKDKKENQVSLEEEKLNICKICYTHKCEVALQCGHIMCENCQKKMTKCPFDKQPVTSVIKLYF